MDVICENAEYCQAKDNYIISDLLDRSHKANDHTEIDLLRQYAMNCGLFEVEREIIEAWEVRQKELIEMMQLTWWQQIWNF